MKTKKERSIYLFLLLRFLLTLVALLLAQVVFTICNGYLFSVGSVGEWLSILWGNIRFGAATVAFVLLPYWILMLLPFNARYKKGFRCFAELIYWIGVLFILVPTLSDAAYYSFTYRRLSADIFQYLTVGGHMGTLGPKFLLGYWYVVLAAILIAAFLIFFIGRNRLSTPKRENSSGSWVAFGLGMILILFLSVSGFRVRPIVDRALSARYCQIQNTPLVTNSAYNILYTTLHPGLAPYQFDDAESAFSPVTKPLAPTAHPYSQPTWTAGGGRLVNSDSTSTDTMRYSNVVVLILESFSQEYMGCYNSNGESYTPFLDSLARYSHLYNGRSNGKKSIESIPAAMAGVPTLMECPIPTSPYHNNTFNSLPTILKKYGYTTSFFHNSYNGVMGFDDFCYHIGFEHYYGQSEYEKKYGEGINYDGVWGIFDEPWLQYMVEEMNQMEEPFFVGEFTISSHHPYTVPEQYKGRFKQGPKPLLQVINYADYALQQFFETASKQPWFNRTLFIIMGDHPGCVIDSRYTGLDGSYRIPMMFYLPGESARGTQSNTIVQQTDLMPTLIDYLGLDESVVCFGNSLFQPRGGWQIVYGNGFYILNKGTQVATLMADNKAQPTIQEVTGRPEDVLLLQSIVQQYNQRMRNNQMTLQK